MGMTPVIQKIDISELPTRNKVCNCKNRCYEAVSITTYNDGMIICMNDARKHLYDMIRLLDDTSYGMAWTKDEEQTIIDMVKKNGMYYGINREIAEKFGRTYIQAKSKTRRMKEKGLI